MNEELDGYFWLPDRPQDEVGGRLTIDASGHASLHLLGSLPLAAIGRIVGRCKDGYYTLEQCFARGGLHTGSIQTQDVHVGHVLAGVAYDEGEEPVFDRLSFSVGGLTEWIQPPDIVGDLDVRRNADGTERPYSLTLPPIAEQSLVLSAGELTLTHLRGFTGDGLRSRTLTQSMHLSWKLASEASLAEVVDLAGDLQSLISIGTHCDAAYDYLHLYHKSLSHNGRPHAVRVIGPWLARPDDNRRDLHPHDMAFTFADIGGIDGICRWLDAAATYRSMVGHVMNTRHVDMFTDVKLAFRVAALHGLHTVWKGKERNLLVALTQLADLAGSPFTALTGDPHAWCAKAKNERNNLAHHYQRLIHQTSTDLYYSAEVSYWLFVLCMMRLADLPPTAIDRVTQCPDFEWLRQQLGTI